MKTRANETLLGNYCTYCGDWIGRAVSVCSNCGFDRLSTKPEPTAKKKETDMRTERTCKKCGDRLARWCVGDWCGCRAKLTTYTTPAPSPKPTLSFLDVARIRSEVRHIPLHTAMIDLAREKPELFAAHESAARRLADLQARLNHEARIASGLARLSRDQRARLDAHERRRASEQAQEQQRRRWCGSANARREARG